MRKQITSSSNRFIAKTMAFKRDSVLVVSEDERIEIPVPDGIPEDMVLPKVGTKLLDVAVSINGSGETLYGFYPAKGTYIVKFHSFAHKNGQLPMAREQEEREITMKDGRKWNMPAKRVFTVLLEVVTGDFKGCLIPHTLDYAFQPDSNGTAKIAAGPKVMERIVRFLELCGLDTEADYEYEENMLPMFETLIAQANEEQEYYFQVTMRPSKRGAWVDEFSELPAGISMDHLIKTSKKAMRKDDEDMFDDEDEDEAPRRRSRPSAKVQRSLDDDEDEPVRKPQRVSKSSRMWDDDEDDED